MAKELLKDCLVTWNATALGNIVTAAEVNGDVEVQDATGFGDTSRVKVLGFTNWTMSLTFQDDFAAAGFNKLRFDAWLAAVAVPIKVRHASGVIGPTNPEWQGNCLITRTPLFNAAVGQISGGQITLEGTGTLVRAVT